jgi:ABC-type glycerol-3-phosphate transport system substrate-binding protein
MEDKMIFRWFTLVSAVLLVAMILGACAPATPTAPVKPATPAEPAASAGSVEEWAKAVSSAYSGQEIKLAVASHPSIEAFKKMTPEFENLTGVKVIWDVMEEGQLASKLLLESSAGKSDYDIIMNCPEFTPSLVDSNYLEPLDGYMSDPAKSPAWFDAEDIIAAYMDMISVDSKHYGIPFAGETIFLFYRKDIFEKHGLSVPTTMEELTKTAAAIQEKETGMAGISMRTRLGWEFTYMWSEFIFPFGGLIIDPTTNKPGFDQPGTKASLKYFTDLATYAPQGVESYSFPEAWDAFMQGKTGMMVEASAAGPEVENSEKSLVAGKVGYAKMPAGPSGAYSGVWGWGFAMTSSSEKKDLAWNLIVYLTSKAQQEKYVLNGGIPSRSSWLEDPANQAKYPYYLTTLDTLKQAADLQAKGLGVVIMDPRWSQISEIMGSEGAKLLTKELSADEALTNMQNQVSEIWQ